MDWGWAADAAQVFGLPVAGLALALGALQIFLNTRTERLANAVQTHREYLQMCFQNPTFSSTEQFLRAYPDERLPDLLKERSEAAVKYLWFLSIMLNSLEQIIDYVSAKGEWRTLAVDQLRYHYGAVAETWRDWEGHYGRTLAGIVEEALVKGSYPSPEGVSPARKQPSNGASTLIEKLKAWHSRPFLYRVSRRLSGGDREERGLKPRKSRRSVSGAATAPAKGRRTRKHAAS